MISGVKFPGYFNKESQEILPLATLAFLFLFSKKTRRRPITTNEERSIYLKKDIKANECWVHVWD